MAKKEVEDFFDIGNLKKEKSKELMQKYYAVYGDIENDIVSVVGEQYRERVHQMLQETRLLPYTGRNSLAYFLNDLDLPKKTLEAIEAHVGNMSFSSSMDKITGNDYVNGLAFIVENKNGGYTKLSFIPVYDEAKLDGLDSVVIHELIHSISTDVFRVNENSYTERSGFQYTNQTIDKVYDKGRKKFYKNFVGETLLNYHNINEVLTEYITCEVMNKRNLRGETIVNSELNKAVYQTSFPFFKPLFDKYKDIFIKAYMEEGPIALENYFGQENLELLDTAFGTINEQVVTTANVFDMYYDVYSEKQGFTSREQFIDWVIKPENAESFYKEITCLRYENETDAEFAEREKSLNQTNKAIADAVKAVSQINKHYKLKSSNDL